MKINIFEPATTGSLHIKNRIAIPILYNDKAGKQEHGEILIWKNVRGKDERTVLFNESENYIVILTDRGGYYMFITAYYIETEHRKRKLLKEYETYIKAKTA